jgi:O-acetyl-ADP-ribose deacetylase (regulator of RNase III)
MIFEKQLNLLTWLSEQTVPSGIIHSCNCFHTMGGGIARQISTQFPAAYEADKDTPLGATTKLGTFSYAQVLSDPARIVYNLYSQFTFGMGKQTLYDPMVEGLEKIRINAISKGLTALGLPFNMGCTLGGGNWKIVRTIIDTIFDTEGDEAIDLYICRYEPKR